MNRLLLVTSSPFVRLSDRGPGRRPRQGASRSWRERTPASHSRRTVIQMKFFHAALVMLAITALGVGQSAAQTGAPSQAGWEQHHRSGRISVRPLVVPKAALCRLRASPFPRLARGEVLTPPLCPLSTAAH